MQWFKHDADAACDAKIKKLIIKHGAVGYAVYFHCLELIVSNISETNVTFELEHDSEIIADDLKIQGNGTKSGSQIVEEIMRTIIELKLFEESEGHIFCFKLLKRLDSSMTSNKKMRELITNAKNEQINHDTVMIPSCYNHDSIMQEETRVEETRVDRLDISQPKKEPKHQHGEYKHVLLSKTEYNKLLSDWGEEKLNHMIKVLDEGIEAKGYKYKNYAMALRTWEKNEKQYHSSPSYSNQKYHVEQGGPRRVDPEGEKEIHVD